MITNFFLSLQPLLNGSVPISMSIAFPMRHLRYWNTKALVSERWRNILSLLIIWAKGSDVPSLTYLQCVFAFHQITGWFPKASWCWRLVLIVVCGERGAWAYLLFGGGVTLKILNGHVVHIECRYKRLYHLWHGVIGDGGGWLVGGQGRGGRRKRREGMGGARKGVDGSETKIGKK